MATTLTQALAGIGTRRRGTAANPRSQTAIASARYANSMKMQFAAIMDTYHKVIGVIEETMPDIVAEALEPTLELAKSYTPKDTGDLRESGYIEKKKVQGVNKVEIGFAKRGDPEYAAIVHERVDLHHAYPTRSKFLSSALNEDLANVYARIVLRCKI